MLAPAINDAIAVARYATHLSTLTILSPVGLFCVMINLILINNFIISIANIHFFLIYANLMRFLELIWSYTGVVLELKIIRRSGA